MLISPISNVQFAYQNANKAKNSNNAISNNSTNNNVANNQVAFTGLNESFCKFFGILPQKVATIEEAAEKLLNKHVKHGQFVKLDNGLILNVSNNTENANFDNRIEEIIIKEMPFHTKDGDILTKEGFTPHLIASFINMPNLKKVTIITKESIKELSIPSDKEARENILNSIKFNPLYTYEEASTLLPSQKHEYLSHQSKSLIEKINIKGLKLIYKPIAV